MGLAIVVDNNSDKKNKPKSAQDRKINKIKQDKLG